MKLNICLQSIKNVALWVLTPLSEIKNVKLIMESRLTNKVYNPNK